MKKKAQKDRFPADASPPSRSLAEGEYLIGKRFRVIREIGRGGMGNVYLCADERLHRNVAVKHIRLNRFEQSFSKQRFMREARTASRLEHINICSIYEIFEEGENNYIVMQYVDGITLDQLIQYKKLSLKRILNIAVQIAQGLMEAHSKNIIHRDIKPGNIIIDQKGVVKILDFGLAKFTQKTDKESGFSNLKSDLTQAGMIVGTACYMSPEQVNNHKLDHRTDIFSFGVLLYEMLERKNPFMQKDQITTLYNVLNKPVTLKRPVPGDLQKIVMKCLQRDRKLRYDRFSPIIEDLKRVSFLFKGVKKSDSSETEILSLGEKEEFFGEISSTGDEEFRDIVSKVKKLKALTRPIWPFQNKIFRWVFAGLLIILLGGAVYFLGLKERPARSVADRSNFLISLSKIKTEVPGEPELGSIIDFILYHSLNQFEEFGVIRQAELQQIIDQQEKYRLNTESESGNNPYQRFRVRYRLEGRYDRNYNFDVNLRRTDRPEDPASIFHITGVGENLGSLLEYEIDDLVAQIYLKIFPQQKLHELKVLKTADYLGADFPRLADLYRGTRYLGNRQINRAQLFLRKADGIPLANLYLAELHYFAGNRNQARNYIEKLYPDQLHRLPVTLRHRVCARQASLDLAVFEQIRHLKELTRKLYLSKEIIFQLAEAYFYQGRALDAKKYYEEALALDPDYSMALNHLGYCYSYLGQHNRAINLLERYSMIDKTANSYDSLGDGYFFQGQLAKSERFKKEAISLDRDSVPWAYMTIADIDVLKRRYDRARANLDQYRRLMGDLQSEAFFHSRNAYIDLLEERPRDALARVERAIQADDSLKMDIDVIAEAYWIKGLILLELGRRAEARRQLEWLSELNRAFQISADHYFVSHKYCLHLKARLLEAEGRIQEAAATFAELMELEYKLCFQITYFHYQFFAQERARFYSRQQQYDLALEKIEDCLAFNPDYLPALELKLEILERLQQNPETFEPLRNRILELLDR